MTRSGLRKWYPESLKTFGTISVPELLVKYIKEERIKPEKSRFQGLATYHDPCNFGRKSEMEFGRGFYDEPRWIMDQCLENRVELYPNKKYQTCCGGGGGTLTTPYDRERTFYGRKKMEQIRAADAKMFVTLCHACHGQINDIKKTYGMEDLVVKYLWELVLECLQI